MKPPLTLGQKLSLEDPLDMDDARRASHRLALIRREAEKTFEEVNEAAADAAHDHSKARAKAILEAEGTEKVKEAHADLETAKLAKDRDLKVRMVKVAEQRLKGLEGERSMLKSLIDWSAGMADRPAPDGPTYGGRA